MCSAFESNLQNLLETTAGGSVLSAPGPRPSQSSCPVFPGMSPSSGGQTLLQRTLMLPDDWQTSKTNYAPVDRKSTTGRGSDG